MHVAAADPTPVAVDRSGVPAELIERERELFRSRRSRSGKPAKVIEKIVEGRINKFYAEVCLLEQPFVKDPDQTIGQAAGGARQAARRRPRSPASCASSSGKKAAA